MTDRVKMLEAVAEAARAWLNVVSQLPYQDQRELDAMSVCENALNAVYSIDALPAELVGETIEVWGYVCTDPRGFVEGRVATDQNYIRGRAAEWSKTKNGPCMGTVFSVRVPLPVVPTITARVES